MPITPDTTQPITETLDGFKHVKNFHNGRAEMYIYSHIGNDPVLGPGILQQDFVKEMQTLTDDLHVQQINVHINSPGGAVLDAMGIFGAIQSSKAVVHTYNDGLAASSAGWVFLAGQKRFMNDFARVMVHDVSAPEGVDSAAVDNFREMIIQLLVNQTGQSSEAILAIMQANTWFNAHEAISAGFADQIINTNRLLQLASNDVNDIQAIYNACNNLLETNDKPKINKMITITNFLSLQEGADEKTVLNAVEMIQNQVKTEVEAKEAATTELEAVKGENTTLKAELEALKTTNKEANDKVAVEYVANLVKEGKVSEDKAEGLTVQAKADFDGVKNIFDAMKAPKVDINNVINAANAGGSEAPKKTLREMEKTDAKGLEKIRNEQPEVFAAMYKAQYGVELTTV